MLMSKTLMIGETRDELDGMEERCDVLYECDGT